jgi:hypothetical protein
MRDNRRQPKQSRSELGCVSTVDYNGQTILVVDAHRNLLDVPKSHLVRAVAHSDNPLTQLQKTLAAFPSGDCCLGHPKVKWFAFERSPNVFMPLLLHSLPESLQDISAMLITAVSFASYQPEQADPTTD